MKTDASPQEDTRARSRISGQAITICTIFGLTPAMILASRFVSASFGGWSQIETMLYLSSFLVFCAFGQGLVILVRGLDAVNSIDDYPWRRADHLLY